LGKENEEFDQVQYHLISDRIGPKMLSNFQHGNCRLIKHSVEFSYLIYCLLPLISAKSTYCFIKSERFDREFVRAKRSFFQKVLEKDEVASAYTVLLVSDIKKQELKLYDGAYELVAPLKDNQNDRLISNLVAQSKIFIG